MMEATRGVCVGPGRLQRLSKTSKLSSPPSSTSGNGQLKSKPVSQMGPGFTPWLGPVKGQEEQKWFPWWLGFAFLYITGSCWFIIVSGSDYIRASWRCFVKSDVFHIQRQGIYGSKCQSEGLVQFWKNYSWWVFTKWDWEVIWCVE